jgi:acetyl esterase/lipase
MAAASGIWRTDPPAAEITLAGRRALRFDPPGEPRGLMLHFHGGAFRIGAPEAVAPFAAAMAAQSGLTVVCPAYRLSPEHPFPAALADGYAVFEALDLSGGLPLILSGDSAGGGLAASLSSLVALARPLAGLVLLSAWLDLTVSSDSYALNAGTDPVFSRAAASEAALLYLQGASAADPLASPLLGDVSGFPSTFISVGSGEVLLRDSTHLYAKLRAAGIQAEMSVIAGMEHVAVTRGFQLAGASETLSAVTRFTDDVLGRHP